MITHARRGVVFSSASELEVAEAALWYEEHRTGLGQRFLAAVRKAAEAAATSPQLYARVHGDLRRVLVHRFPYALIFRETHDQLLIAACYPTTAWASSGPAFKGRPPEAEAAELDHRLAEHEGDPSSAIPMDDGLERIRSRLRRLR